MVQFTYPPQLLYSKFYELNSAQISYPSYINVCFDDRNKFVGHGATGNWSNEGKQCMGGYIGMVCGGGSVTGRKW